MGEAKLIRYFTAALYMAKQTALLRVGRSGQAEGIRGRNTFEFARSRLDGGISAK
ncbi:hypothetical protein [Paenibacillus sp. S150]|uniref:hypothetical protein n=1 Tax=Paenibacillus sp. S150 TaxID=2749826 RepID=UPI001C56167C|nr:hypothetical protein [Paenibacillus sp. S150]MBW4083905.1 hypothetical protein [Paenibacillus sp. S150]